MTQPANTGSVGAGQLFPGDANSDFDVITFVARQLIAQLEIMLPVQVVAAHPGAGSPPAAGTVDAQLLVSLLDGSGNAVQQGVVYGLPYFRLQGGPWAIICDPAKGDYGYIQSASRDISNVKKNPGIQNPASLRKHSYSDGVYVGGMLNAVPAATLWLKPDGTFVLTDAKGNVLQSTGTGIAWTVPAGGDFTVNGISLLNHTHAVSAAPGETGPPVG